MQSNDNSCIEQICPDKAKILDKVRDLDDCLPTYNSFIRTVETINEIISINPNIILLVTNYKDDRGEEFLENELDKKYKDIQPFISKIQRLSIMLQTMDYLLLSYTMKALCQKGSTRAFLKNIEDF